MKTFSPIWMAVLFLLATSPSRPATAQEAKKLRAGGPDAGSVERGRYIVEGVAMCGRCHTPGNVAGEMERDHRNWLKGGPLQIQATYPIADFALITPRLAGGPPGTDDDFIRLLTTGIARTGAPPRPPMPHFRMTRSDAESILAYLKSLGR